MFQLKFVEKIRTRFLSWMYFSRISWRLWDQVENTVDPKRTQMRMQFGACVLHSENTHTHTTHAHMIFNTYCFSAASMVTRMRLNVTLCIYCLSCWVSTVVNLTSAVSGSWPCDNDSSNSAVSKRRVVPKFKVSNAVLLWHFFSWNWSHYVASKRQVSITHWLSIRRTEFPVK